MKNERLSALIRELQAGEADAWEQLYELREQLILTIITKAGSREDAEDIVQETMLRLFQNRQKINPNENVFGFIVTTLKRICIDQHRKNQARPQTEFYIGSQSTFENGSGEYPERFVPVSNDAQDPVFDAVARRLEQETLLNTINQLPEAQREVMMLRIFHDLSQTEIAIETDAKIGTVKQRWGDSAKKIGNQLQGTILDPQTYQD